tara:strand:+ start:1104 stop:1628 length:525 start_codon:yes stop_codon:yes gene_type:complete
MDINTLKNFSEITLKYMIIDLSKKNENMKEKLTKSHKEQFDRLHKEYLEINKKNLSLEIDLKFYKSIIDTFAESPCKIIAKWMEQSCEPADNVLAEDNKTSIAPTNIRTLYDNFEEWCSLVDIYNKNQIDMKTFKCELKKWQEKSEYGLNCGKRKDQSGSNGYESNMLVNLKLL